MKKQTVILVHSIYWFYKILWTNAVGQFFSKNIKFNFKDFLEPLILSGIFLSLLIFYINYLFVLPKFYKKKKYALAFASWIGLIILWVLLRYLIEEVLFLKFLGYSNYYGGTTLGYYIFDNIYWVMQPLAMSFFLWLINDLIKTEKEKSRLEQEKRKAEVSFLRSQVNPHFIFNTMNNIYSLVYHQSQKALPAIEKLSGIMRYVMKDSGDEKIALTKEIDYLKDFIELQSLRIEGANIQFKQEGKAEGKMIAPLILIPFVENSFKHGVLNDPEKPVTISLNIQDQHILFSCSNTIAGGIKDESSGIGLQNVKRRLELLYPGQHQLDINHMEKEYTITLHLNLQP